MVGLALWIAGAVVTAVGQLATEGGLLIGWVAVETGTTVLVVGATVMLLGRQRDRRVAAEALLAIVGVWLLLTTAGMVGELASGLAPGWLWADGPLTAGTGAVYLTAGVFGWRHDRQRAPR